MIPFIVFVFVLSLVVSLWIFGFFEKGAKEMVVNIEKKLAELSPARQKVAIFLIDENEMILRAEAMTIPEEPRITESIRRICELLIPDNKNSALKSPISPGTELLNCFVDDRENLYLYFEKPLFEPSEADIQCEILARDALLATMFANFRDLKNIQLIFDQPPMGHLKWELKFTPKVVEKIIKDNISGGFNEEG